MKKSWWIAIAIVSIILNLYLSYSILNFSRNKSGEIGTQLKPSKHCKFIAVLFIPRNTCYPVDEFENYLKKFRHVCVIRKIFQEKNNRIFLKYTGFSPSLLLFTSRGDLILSIPLEKSSSQETKLLLKIWISRLEALNEQSD